MQHLLPPYLLLFNAAGFLIMYMDKQLARKKRFRVPEVFLLTIALAGGSLGSLLGMAVFRHKTRKLRFRILIPLFLCLHLFLLLLWL